MLSGIIERGEGQDIGNTACPPRANSSLFVAHLWVYSQCHHNEGFCVHNPYIYHLQYGEFSLILASENRHEEVVRVLLSAGAQADQQDKVSSTNDPW